MTLVRRDNEKSHKTKPLIRYPINQTFIWGSYVFLLQKEALYLNMNVYKLPTMETK